VHNGKQVREKPYFKTVRIRILEDTNVALLALKKGDIDDMILTPSQWTSLTGGQDFYARNTKATGLEWVYFYFGWNLETPFFADVQVRKAMSYAFDHEKMLKNLCYGLYEPANGIYYRTAWMAPQKPLPFYKHDPDKAEDLLDAAGWTDHDGDGVRDKMIDGKLRRFEFTILCASIPERVEFCKLLQQNLKEIGVKCNVRPLEPATLQQMELDKQFEAYFGGWGTGTDPDSSENLWKTGERRNFVSFSNPEVDKLFEAGRREFDPAKRAAIYATIDELIYAEQPYTFLYFRNSFYGFNKQLRGYKFSPRGPFNYSPGFSSMWMAE
jgi:peptide/nickel transport system substrate-binding protein